MQTKYKRRRESDPNPLSIVFSIKFFFSFSFLFTVYAKHTTLYVFAAFTYISAVIQLRVSNRYGAAATIERNGSRVRAINQMENYRLSIPHSAILYLSLSKTRTAHIYKRYRTQPGMEMSAIRPVFSIQRFRARIKTA